MSAFFSFLFVISIIATLVTLIIALVSFLRKKPHRKYLKIAGISAVIGTASLVGAMATQTPEERAAQQQRAAERQEEKDRLAAEKQAQKEKEEAEKQARKAQEAAESDAKKAQEAKEKEKVVADAIAQKRYDDQAEYEDWLKSTGVIGTIPGLGDRISVFEQRHKRTRGNDPDSYDDNLLSVMKDEGRILFITINALGRSLDPNTFVTPLLPVDGVRVSSSDDKSDELNTRRIFIGHSDMLEIVLPQSKGYYTRMDVYHAPTGDYIYTNIFTGRQDDPDTL